MWVKIFLVLVSFGRRFKQMMVNLFELDGATSKKQDRKQQQIQENDKTIEANRQTIESFAALLGRTQQLADEKRQEGLPRPYNHSSDVKECDMQFWLAGQEGSVIVGMSRSFWDRLQRQEGKAWAKILTFVEEEYERREEEE